MRAIWTAVVAWIAAGTAGGQWVSVEEAKLVPSGVKSGENAGWSVALDGNAAVLGVPHRDQGFGVYGTVRGLAFHTGQQRLYGADEALSRLVSITPAGQANKVIGPALVPAAGMAFDPAFSLFYLVGDWGGLYQVNANGFGTATWYLTAEIVGLAFDPVSQTIYGSASDRLVTIAAVPGASNATAIDIGPFGFSDVQGLEFDPGSGTLYGTDCAADQLLAIDPTTGAAAAIGPLGFERVEGLALDPASAVLYGSDTASDQLVTIDVSTGAASALAQISGPLTWSGGAHVFRRNGTTWSEEAVLAPSAPANMDVFGSAVAVSGDTIVVGAPGPNLVAVTTGAAHVFVRSGSQWVEQAVLRASDGALGDRFGASVAIGGDTLLVGAPYDGDAGVAAGSAYVFERQAGAWVESAKLISDTVDTGDQFGHSVALDGSRCLIGAPHTSVGPAQSAGVGYTFVRTGSTWSQEARLGRKAHEFGISISGECYDKLGWSAALRGDVAVLGAPGYENVPKTAVSVGAAWVYGLTAAGWTEKDRIKGPPTSPDYDDFGVAVAAGGDRVVAGAYAWLGPGGGRADLYAPQENEWKKKLSLTASDALPKDRLGWSLSLSGDTLIAGAAWDDHPTGMDAGSAYVFRLAPPAPTVYCTAGTSASGCVALLAASGTPSASAPSGFTVSASGVEGSRTGMFVFGQGGKQAIPWGSGTSFQCAPPPLAASGPLPVMGTLGTCDGFFSLDVNALWCSTCPKPAINPGEGSVVQLQLWYRDPLSTSNQVTSFSDAIEFWVLP